MSLDTLALIKLISFIATAGFTITGALTKDRAQGRITWRRVSTTGAIVSLLLSITLIGFEQRALAASRTRAAAAQAEANGRFDAILKNVATNIAGTNETLDQTKVIATGVSESVRTQARVVTQTEAIATDLDKSIAEQAKILKANQAISIDLKESIGKQQRALEAIERVSKDQLVSNEQQKEIQAQQGVILKNTLRSMTLLNPLALNFSFRYPSGHPWFAAYVERLRAFADARFKGQFTYDPELRITVSRGPDQRIAGIDIDDGSPLFPARNVKGEEEPGYGLNLAILKLNFYKDAPSIAQKGSPDMSIQAMGWNPRAGIPSLGFRPIKIRGGGASSRIDLHIDYNGKTITQNVFTNSVSIWKGQNEIVSLVDLPDTLLEVQLIANPEQTLEAFEILLGDNYSRFYLFDPNSFTKVADGLVVQSYHRFTAEELKLPF